MYELFNTYNFFKGYKKTAPIGAVKMNDYLVF